MQKRLSGSCWQMHVASHRSSTHFGFQSDPVGSGHPFNYEIQPCGASCFPATVCHCGNDQYISHYHMFSWQLKVFIYLPCSVECQSWYYPWSHAFKVIALYKMCIYDVIIIDPLIEDLGLRTSHEFNFMIDSTVDMSNFFTIIFFNFIYRDLNISCWYQGSKAAIHIWYVVQIASYLISCYLYV